MADTARLRAAAALMRNDAPHWHPVAAWLDATADEANRHADAGMGNCPTEVTQPHPIAVADAYLKRMPTPPAGSPAAVRLAVRDLIAAVRAVPVDCTGLTGPVWYGAGWKEAVDHLEEIADAWPAPDAAPVDLDAIRARVATRNDIRARMAELLGTETEDAADLARVATGLEAELGREVPALLAVVDKLIAQRNKACRERTAAQRFTSDAYRARDKALAALASQPDDADAREEFVVECRVKGGRWVEWIVARPTLDQALAVCGPDPDPRRYRVRQVRHSDRVVWPPEELGHEKAPEAAQDAVAHPETREEPVSRA